MEGLQTLDTPVLLDMLSELTIKYTKMMSEGSDEDSFSNCKVSIQAIQKEIALRKDIFDANATVTTQPPEFE